MVHSVSNKIKLDYYSKFNILDLITEGRYFVSPSQSFKQMHRDFPGGPVVKNLPAKARYMDLIPGPGRFHMLWGN